MGEDLTELQKQREDIKILLSTLEEAYSDASITEEHYKEVKGKNEKRLKELDAKISKLEASSAGPAEKEGPAKEGAEKAEKEKPEEPKPEKAKPRKRGRPKGSKSRPKPAPAHASPSQPSPESAPAQPSTSTSESAPSSGGEAGSGGQSDYSGIPQPLTDIAGEGGGALGSGPDKGSGPTAEPGSLRYTAQEVKDMLDKVLKEIRPEGIEVAPKVEKLEVQLEKLRAYIEAMKDEKSGSKEGIQRLTEELGEMRSNVSGIDRKVSESEMKVQEIDQALGDLRPQRFTKALQDEDKTIKLHEARLDKLDDLNSVVMKKVGQIEEVLKRLGSLEKIVNFSKEAAKRLIEIENREKKINRVADKIDGIFVDLNKRLQEFALYKAKQDTMDELSQEMMKSMDELNTKMEKYVEKSELESFKDAIQAELASIRTAGGASPEVQKLESQKTEIEGLIAMLDEQFKAGALPEKEYKKTKAINQQRLESIDKKIQAAQSGQAVSGETESGAPAPTPVSGEAGSVEAAPEEGGSPESAAPESNRPGESGASGARPGDGKGPEAKPTEEGGAPEGGSQPAGSEATGQEPGQAMPSPPAPEKQGTPGNEGASGTKDQQAGENEQTLTRQQELLAELENSYARGLISREAAEKARKLVKDDE